MHINYNNCIKAKSYVNSITFKATKLEFINLNKYYNCYNCKNYSTHKTSNFKRNLMSCNPSGNESINAYSKSIPDPS